MKEYLNNLKGPCKDGYKFEKDSASTSTKKSGKCVKEITKDATCVTTD